MTKQKLDGRTKQAKQITELKQQLREAPAMTTKQLLVDLIARNSVIENELFNQALSQGLIDDTGNAHPIIKKELLRYQGATKTALTELLRLENKLSDDTDSEGIFDDIFNED